ncbi:MAG: DNA translocase FtsK [Oscillospiraceae bacterium]|nr:DNA translocase FtsK [Oscillospiraceae bacterium]
MPKPVIPGNETAAAGTKNKKPATQGKDAKNTSASGKSAKGKKSNAALDAAAEHRQHVLLVMGGVAVFLFLLAAMFLRGENIWFALHAFLWGLFGALFPFWLASIAFFGVIWARKQQPLRAVRGQLIGVLALLLSVGGLLFLFSHDADVLSETPWKTLVATSFEIEQAGEEQLDLFQAFTNGGLFSTLFAATVAKGCGKAGALVLYFLSMAGFSLLAFPRLLAKLTDVLAVHLLPPAQTDAPTEAEPEAELPEAEAGAPQKGLFARLKNRLFQRGDAVEESDEPPIQKDMAQTQQLPPLPERYYAQESDESYEARRQMFLDFQNWQVEAAADGNPPGGGGEGSLPSTVIENLGSATPGPEHAGDAKELAMANLAGRIAPENPARTKAQQAGDEAAARAAAIDALIQDATAAAPAEYTPPPVNCLSLPRSGGAKPDKGEEDMIERKLLRTLESFGVMVEMVGRSRGPAVTRYELRPAEGVKISKITALADDIALRLAATKVRIEAPIPGKPAVGVEVPNRVRAVVSLRELVESDAYRTGTQKSRLTVALGKDIVGSFVCADLAKLPHLLIAGTTGSGKSVCMNTLILSLLYNASPAQVKLIMVDPKQVEFTVYSSIPHLLVPVVSDPLKAAGALGWAVNEMERRYTQISEQNVRDLDSYNAIAEKHEGMETMPKIVIFIDELSDLMMVAPSDVEDSIQRLTQKGRAAGIHLVVATQRPSVDVITGVIKSNLPGRIALSVASQIDSRTIINSAGAEQLLGNGDMLFSLNGGNNAVRVQGCYVSDPEVQRVTRFVRDQSKGEVGYDDSVWEEIERNAAMAGSGKKKGGMAAAADDDEGDDPMFASAVEVVVDAQLASTTMLQKKLKLGYARASRLVDLLEEKGIVGPPEGSKPRKVLIGKAQWLEISASGASSAAQQQPPQQQPAEAAEPAPPAPLAAPWGE